MVSNIYSYFNILNHQDCEAEFSKNKSGKSLSYQKPSHDKEKDFMAKADWELLPAHHAVKRMRNLTAESIQPLPERAWCRNFRSPSEHQLPLTWLCSEDPTWREISSIKSVIIPLSPHLSVSLRQENRSLFQVRIPPFKIWAWRSEAVGVSP